MVLVHVSNVHVPVHVGRTAHAAPIRRFAAVRPHMYVPNRLAVERLPTQGTLEVPRLIVNLHVVVQSEPEDEKNNAFLKIYNLPITKVNIALISKLQRTQAAGKLPFRVDTLHVRLQGRPADEDLPTSGT